MAEEVKTVPGSARQSGYSYVPVPGNADRYFEVAQTALSTEIADPSSAGRKLRRQRTALVRNGVDLSANLLTP